VSTNGVYPIFWGHFNKENHDYPVYVGLFEWKKNIAQFLAQRHQRMQGHYQTMGTSTFHVAGYEWAYHDVLGTEEQ